MDPDQKDLIEKAAKSDYFDKVLEIHLRNKISEMIKRNKWYIALIVVIIAATTGFNIYDIFNTSKQRQSLDDRIEQLDNQMSKLELRAESVNEQIKASEASFNAYREYTRQSTSLTEKELSFLSDKYNHQESKIESLIKENESLAKKSESNIDAVQSINAMVDLKIANLDTLMYTWQAERCELIKLSTCQYVFVQKGSRKPDDWGFRPKYVDLPFCDQRIQIAFNHADKNTKQFSKEGHPLPTKIVETMITLYDASGKIEYSETFFLEELVPNPIPGTKFQITPHYVYIAPNVLGFMIPDYTVYAITPQGQAMDNLFISGRLD